jgi:probable addiction module antidote protein
MKTEYAPLDISSLLDSEEMIVGYLTAAAEDEDPNVLLGALAHAAKARGMAQVAKAAGLGRESLYKALAPGSHPRFETIAAVLRALGVKVEFARGRATAKSAPRTLTIDDFRPIKPADREPSSKAKPTTLSKEDRKLLAKRKLLAERKQAAKRPAAKRRA